MKVTAYSSEVRSLVESMRLEGKMIGLVPTMGALHKGHISLVQEAMSRDSYIIVTIFVNPTQFNDPGDLERYPRTMEADLSMLEKLDVDLVFAPSVEEIYPEKDERIFDLSPLDEVMEGKYRPGHFNGVAQVVSKLFDICSPHHAYFGEKDFQQLAIIRKMVSETGQSIQIIGCPIVREEDGLAMSSRNQLLDDEQRKAAPMINRILKEAASNPENLSPGELVKWVTEKLNNQPLLKVEYFEIVDSQTLKPVKDWTDPGNKIGCIAVQIGKIRLIDNRYFH